MLYLLMLEINEKKLSEVLKSISDVTRRKLLTQIIQQGKSRVTDLAKYYDMSLNAISKHIKILEKSNLIIRKKIGRTHYIEANITDLSLIDDYLSELKNIWQLRLNELNNIIIKENIMNESTITINQKLNCSTKTAFEAWLNPEILAKFIFPMPGMDTPTININAKLGEGFEIIMKMQGQELLHKGKYLIIEEYNNIKFTWSSDFSPEDSSVNLTFTKIEDNKCNITLTHTKFLNEETKENHTHGWTNVLNNMNTVLTN